MSVRLVGACIPIVVAWPLYNKLVDVIYQHIPMIKSLFTFRFGIDIFSVLLPFALLFVAILVIIGSTISLRKHLNV